MKVIETEVITAEPVRRITLELTEERAKELKEWLAKVTVWSSSDVGAELEGLHEALGGW